MNRLIKVMALALAGTLAGCVEPAAYQSAQANAFGYEVGFDSRPLKPAEFCVIFIGNPATAAQRVSDFASLRAAQLTLENHFRYFVILREMTLTPAIGLPRDVESDAYGVYQQFGEPGTAAAENGSWDYRTALKTTVSTRTLVIHCYASPPALGSQATVYDASAVAAELRRKYALDSATAYNS